MFDFLKSHGRFLDNEMRRKSVKIEAYIEQENLRDCTRK